MQEEVASIRSFNRFYTQVIGLLDHHFLQSPYSLLEVRILFEIKHMPDCTARKIMERISIDEGYLSRIIQRFVKDGLLEKKRSADDGRAYFISFTPKGEREFAKLNEASERSIHGLIKDLPAPEIDRLIRNMDDIRIILSKTNGHAQAG